MAVRIEENIPLAAHTTLHVGGVAAYFHRLTDEQVLPELAVFAQTHKVPVWVLGGGSNVLVGDGVIKRLVLKNELTGMVFAPSVDGGVCVTVAAGESWDGFVAAVVARGLAGVENLSGIPGTVGAAPIQNINAYGAQVADVIESVRVFDIRAMHERVLTAAECAFGYRDSIFKHAAGTDLVVLEVTFLLTKTTTANLQYRSSSQSVARYLEELGVAEPSLADVRAAILYVRSNIGMLAGQFRSAGSFFKNTIVSKEQFAEIESVVHETFSELDEKMSPWHWEVSEAEEKISTAFLLECSAYNKRTYGKKRFKEAVGISPKHSLSVVTEAGATTADVLEFVALIVSAVENIFGVTIEPEVNFVLE